MKPLRENRLACVPLLLLAAAYAAFLLLDLFLPQLGWLSTLMKYAGILLCLLTALLLRRNAWNRRDGALLAAALGFTAVADLFLLLRMPVPGLLAFCVVHLIYIRRYRRALFVPVAVVVLAAVLGCVAAAWRVPGFPLENVLAGIYGMLLLTVLVCSITSALPKTNRRIAAAGMVLFLLCDIHVALFNVLPANSAYYPYAAFLMWFFYLPSQALLAVSGYEYERC